jgi:hypothetical protein
MAHQWSTWRALSRRRPWYDHRERQRCPLPVERLTYHALLAGLQALLAEDYAGSLMIMAERAFGNSFLSCWPGRRVVFIPFPATTYIHC